MLTSFVHLRVHTEFSLVDSVVRIKPLIKAVAANMPAVALTDQSNMFAMIKFYRAAVASGVKPLIGVDARISTPGWAYSPVVLLAQDDQGYANISELVSRSFLHGQHGADGATIDQQWLEGNSDGIIALSGGRFGDVGQALMAQRPDEAQALLAAWQKLFPGRFYLELQRTGRDGDEAYIQAVLPLAKAAACPVVASNDVRFVSADHFDAHEARVCIHQGEEIASPRRARHYSEQQYLRSAQEMIELFADIPSAIENTLHIARRCNLDITLGDVRLPDFPVPEGMTEAEFLQTLSIDGLNDRLGKLFDTNADNFAAIRKPYDERLARELDVIIQMEFPGYFLIVADFIQWSRANDVPVGPGRGSGAGSLVAYALGITDVDPLEHDLLFERFLNPERVSMPDFDIDFCMDKRDRVIQYVAEKYGSDKVSQIITYGTMAAKAVVRDVARVMGHPYGFGDRLAKMVPPDLGITLTAALDQSEELRRAYDNEEDLRAVVDMALQLEGVARNAGKHAGGVVIAPTRLTDFTPLYCEPDGSSLVTQFDKDDAEAVGLVKFDFLGLRTLTVLANAVSMVNLRRPADHQLDLDRLPFDDAPTYSLLQQANTTGVFQLESTGMKKLIAQLRPDCFDDIVALVALYRPGPMNSGMVEDFVARKNGGAPIAYPHPDYQHDSLIPTLKSTYGVIVYQEQVMKIGQVLAGYSLGGADVLRRAMGKKKPEEMAKQRAVFVEGCLANGIDESLSSNIFDLVEKFAGYGFNKSHSVAYAVLSYHTAWLKCHYPAEFYSAVMSADMDSTEKVVKTIEDMKAMGLSLLPPDINSSEVGFRPSDPKTVRFGLGAIKGVGGNILEKIIGERRANGQFANLLDLCKRLSGASVARSVLECLIRSGALDCLAANRATLMENLPVALSAASQQERNASSGQSDMFGEIAADEVETIRWVEHEEWPETERLMLERKTTGMFLSGHPINPWLGEIARFASGRLAEQCERAGQPAADAAGHGRRAGIDSVAVGLVSDARIWATNRGGRRMNATIDDCTARIDVNVPSELIETDGQKLVQDAIVVVEGSLSFDSYLGGHSIRARSIYSIEEARRRFARLLLVTWRRENSDASLAEFKAALARHGSGSVPVFIDYENDAAKARIKLGNQWQINPTAQLLESLTRSAGVSEVDLVY